MPNLRKYFTYVAIPVMIAALFTEVAWRGLLYYRISQNLAPTRTTPYPALPWTRRVYGLAPNLSQNFGFASDRAKTYEVKSNSLGFRDREFKDLNRFKKRVVVLGDSYTLGEAVAAENAFPQVTEKLLNQKSPNSVGVMNLGQGGYDTIQEAAVLEELGPKLHPDVVVLEYTMNDAEPPNQRIANPAIMYQYAYSWAWEDFKISLQHHFLKGRHRLVRKLISVLPNSYTEGYSKYLVNGRAVKDSIAQIAKRCASLNARLEILILPDTTADFQNYPYYPIHQQVRRWADELGIRTIDMMDEFEKMQSTDLRTEGDGHPNETYHHKVAQVLARELETTLTLP